jgi:hypothetical protein
MVGLDVYKSLFAGDWSPSYPPHYIPGERESLVLTEMKFIVPLNIVAVKREWCHCWEFYRSCHHFGTCTQFWNDTRVLSLIAQCVLLLWIYGSVTNNNGFWIGWLDLLTSSCTIVLNHNQLQEIALDLQPNRSSLTAEDLPHSRSHCRTLLPVLRLD